MDTYEKLISIKSHYGYRYRYTVFDHIERSYDVNGYFTDYETNLINKFYREEL